jgi:DNA-binding MarR family transcriptional regulator
MREADLYRGQGFILRALVVEEGITQSELAEHLQVRPATVSNALRRMEAAGLLERRGDDEDQRISRVFLTDAGRSAHEALVKAWESLEADAFAGLTGAERATLRDLLDKVLHNLVPGPKGPGGRSEGGPVEPSKSDDDEKDGWK